MNKYSECYEYLIALGFPEEVCEKICRKYENAGDVEGLMDYVLLCEAIVDVCVD